MQFPIAASRFQRYMGTILWGDSAYVPAQPVIAVRLPRMDAPANFGGVGTYIGQSYERGVHPPR